jgi:hypothetical protein
MSTPRSRSLLVFGTGLAAVATCVLAYIAAARFRQGARVRFVSRMLLDRMDANQKKCRVSVVQTMQEWEQLESELLKHVERHPLIGLDCEWVTPRNGGAPRKISLLQLATADGWCVLLRLNKLKLCPKSLFPVLADPAIIKLGVGIQDDAFKLKNDFAVSVRGWFDLRHLAGAHRPEATKLGMAGLALSFLGVHMDKDWRVRASDWEAGELSDRQVNYAANDALVPVNVVLQVAAEVAEQSMFGWRPQSVADLAEIAHGLCKTKAGLGFKAKKGGGGGGGGGNNPKQSKPGPNNRTQSTEKDTSKSKMVTRKTPLYHNSLLEAPDGQPLCACDTKKAEWYVTKGLGVKVKDEPFTVRLTFEPSGRPEGEAGDYYLTFKDNHCVVCGITDSYLRKYIVPHEYRKHFPGRSRNDIFPCVQSHQFTVKRIFAFGAPTWVFSAYIYWIEHLNVEPFC